MARATPSAKPSISKSPAASPSIPTSQVPAEKIAQRAYEKWCGRGMPAGTAQQDWLEAETELKAEMTTPKGKK